ncbi:hypothetical protein M427DRAFT_59236 [Gonapodya prolifera JEL478]|uniref:Uncharacterized protein n=1 Tax=Gonapodya prolifera (strain JEL478) TaxID=1344416 RepID=A0A139A7C6_GONPJ|nr:hypothetical protein M427DRAFT_59236 [Gonapodya prolifera JEL478]|eukprot:KXS12707.1 hypothetical protein M427DRAFT_59236 [Gonapodya prolifera JEL478]
MGGGVVDRTSVIPDATDPAREWTTVGGCVIEDGPCCDPPLSSSSPLHSLPRRSLSPAPAPPTTVPSLFSRPGTVSVTTGGFCSWTLRDDTDAVSRSSPSDSVPEDSSDAYGARCSAS